MRRRQLGAVLALVLVALLAAGVLWWRAQPEGAFEEAVSHAPADAQRLTFTDWAGVRRELGSDIDGDSSAEEVRAFLAEAFEEDLSPMSALLESTPTMHEEYGFSPATLDWELLSQSEAGAAVLMRLPAEADVDAVRDRMEELGYQRPEEETGVWVGGIDLLPKIGVLTPELQYLGFDEDSRIVVSSDTESYAQEAMAAVTGESGSLRDLDDMAGVIGALGTPLAAAVYDGQVACTSLAMSSADAAEQDQADELLAAAGEVAPMTGFAMAVQPDRDVRVAMGFETASQARTNADTRSVLATGPAPGQGGSFSDRFRLGKVTAEDEVVTMRLEPHEGEYVLSDLTSGPVLFATC